MSDVPSPSWGSAPTHEQRKGKGTSRKDISRTGKSSTSGKRSCRDLTIGVTSDSEQDVYRPSPTVARASTSQEEACAPPWNAVMEVLAGLRADLEELKKDRDTAPDGGGVAGHVDTPPSVTVGNDASPSFSGFHAVRDPDDVAQEDIPMDSVLMQCAKLYGPVDDLSDGIDNNVADMVNHVFESGMRDDEYKEIMEADVVKRPSNCPALAPVECNTQVWDALKPDARKADFRMKEVSKDIVKAATIITKSLTVMDKVTQEGSPEVAKEIHMLNGALALLGHANHRNNLTRRFIIKREINQKYVHLCADKAPMTRFLFGDDVSQSAKAIEELERLKTKFTAKKQLPTWRFGAGRGRGYFGITPIATALLARGWTTDRISRGRLRRQKTPGAGGPTTPSNK